MKIFKAQISNGFQAIVPLDSYSARVISLINSKSMANDWVVPEFDFSEVGKSIKKQNCGLLGGGFIIPEEAVDKLFLKKDEKIEFLPILISSEKWIILNCLNLVKNFNSDESIFFRGPEDQIFLINHLVIELKDLPEGELFVVDGSNRSSLFTSYNFVKKFSGAGFFGVEFKEAGFVYS